MNYLIRFISCYLALASLVCTGEAAKIQAVEAGNISDFLASMPPEDREDLESLFRSLMADGDFAYTLFGEKPLAFFDCILDFELGIVLSPSALNSFATNFKGWLVWQKYKTILQPVSLIFLDYINEDCTALGFLLCNKEKARQIYLKYENLMADVFGEFENVPHCLISLQPPADEDSYHQALGHLLGYDEMNAIKFSQRNQLLKMLRRGPYALDGLSMKSKNSFLSSFREKKSSARSDVGEMNLSQIILQLNGLYANAKGTSLSSREARLSPIRIPSYMVFDENCELTIKQRTYDEIRCKLVEIYFSENFLEIVLTRLLS